MKKICMLLFNNLDHDPRVFKFAVSLAENGYSIDILSVRIQNKERISVLAHNVVLKRIFPYLFVVSAPHKYIFNIVKLIIYAIKSAGKISFIHCNDAETLPFGFLLKLFNKNAKVIYDAHEYIKSYLPLPKSIIKKTGYALTYSLYSSYERIFIKKADALVSVGESIVERLVEDHQLSCRALCIYNSLDFSNQTTNYLYEEFKIGSEKKIIIFIGALDSSRELENIIKTLSCLGNEYCLVLLGRWTSREYKETIYRTVTELRLSERVFEGFLPYEKLVAAVSKAALSIFISNPSTVTLKYSMPNKFWESIAAGVPFVVNSELTEISRFVKKYRIGLVVSSMNPKIIALEIQRLMQTSEYLQMKDNIKHAQALISWKNEKKKLINLYEDLKA